jgi:bifunctional non-homologous end joining protein LigD
MAKVDRTHEDSRLRAYRRRRSFRKTSEPAGSVAKRGEAPVFVVQKHGARRLHYDFRLELGGVLLSWAVPKGPSLDPSVKRLAVHVEDHPREYADFEGTIPAGEYGAGAVMLWDRGRWEPSSDPQKGYRKGHLSFRLFGKKLKGGWTLVRARGEEREEKNWFLIKHKDKESNGRDLLREEPGSVASGRTLEEIAAGKTPKRSRRRKDDVIVPDPSRLPGATPAKRPKRLHPQLAASSSRLPTAGDWLYEVKFDGYRILAFLGKDGCRFISRNGNDWSARFPRLCRALRDKGRHEAIIDGEVVSLRSDGTSDFQALQSAFRSKSDTESLVYFAFDLPYCNGYDLTRTPLIERKSFLQRFLAAEGIGPGVHFSEHVRGTGNEFLRFACESRLEGIVCKRADGAYRQERSSDWRKIKCLDRQEFVVGGFTLPGGSRHGFGALLLGLYDDSGRLLYTGRVGTGFDRESLNDLVRRMKQRLRRDCPFHEPPVGLDRTARWIEPELVVEVEFKERTRDGLLRQPSFQGLREDKAPREITLEPPAPVERKAGRRGGAVPAPGRARGGDARDTYAGVRITHPDRIVYPDQGITKRELAAYYERISKWILPHVAERPLAVVRCPKGRRGDCFFQKHATETLPEEVRSVEVKEKGEVREYIMIDSVKGLLSLVQFGTLEFHPWGSRADKLEMPDRMIFDLDPSEGIPWKTTVDAAFRLRSVLEELGLESFVRTTGGKGLHVVVPLLRRSGWNEIGAAAAAAADYMVGRHPSRYVRTMTRSARKGKIFIDHFRNRQGSTAIASYSTRALGGAPVAAPVSWEELSEGATPGDFTVRSIPDRLERLKGDPWKNFFAVRQSIRLDAKESRRLAS